MTAHLRRHTLVAGAVLTLAIAAAGTELLGLDPRNVLFFLAVLAGVLAYSLLGFAALTVA